MRSQTAISLVLTASLALGGGGAAPAVALADAAVVTVKVGQAEAFSRIEFDGVQPRSARREGADLVLSFGDVAPPDLALLKVDPPRYVKTAAATRTVKGLELRLTLADNIEVKVGKADGGTYVNLYPGDPSAAAPADQTADHATNPVPASGSVRLQPALKDGVLSMRFAWRAPVGAAMFRRGEAIWLVFDAKAGLDLSAAPHGLPQARRVDEVADPHATALRISVPASVQASLAADGAAWTLSLGGAPPPPAEVKLKADVAATPAELSAQMAGTTGVFWLQDPAVGDRLAVITARAPAKGVLEARSFVDADVLASGQGLALVAQAQDLRVSADGDVVHIVRPKGMALSDAPAAAHWVPAGPVALPQATAMPALVDFDGWSKTGEGGFLARYDALQQAAFDEGGKGRDAPTVARFGFARFLVGSELGFEAIGVLDLMAKADPTVMGSAEFRGLRGAARAMSGRYKDAQADFSAPALMDDPASAVWRGYLSAQLGDNAGARQSFASGRGAMSMFAPRWRARFERAEADALIGVGDLVDARAALDAAAADKPEGAEAQRVRLDEARLTEAEGHPDQALPLYDEAAQGDYGGVAAPALMHAVAIRQAEGRITPDAAIDLLNSIRFRWRGDATELEAIRTLGRIYIAQGRYREALEAMQAARQSSPDLPASAAVQADLQAAFRDLFLNGGADGLPPVQALALFLDFKDQTPIGADGDLMVRKLARRLVDVDLLDQAAELMKYQADNRLDGVPRAQVDTDLALIQLMNRQPEAALDALNASRTTLLPAALQEQRRVIEARALTALGRYDDALEMVAADKSPDAAAAEADIAWKKRDWAAAGKMLEVALGARWKSADPLNALDEASLMRCAIAYSLAGDDGSLNRLRSRYAKLAEGAPNAAALKVALAGVKTGPTSGADYARAAAADDVFATWVATMKAKLMNAPGMKA